MAENSKIEWTDHTFNPWVGCTKISPACDHCYAESWAKRTGNSELWGGVRRRTTAANWRGPLKWNREASERGLRYRVFCASLADVFDNAVPMEWRADLFGLIEQTPRLDWLLLTKRIGNVPKMLDALRRDGFPPNVWLGSTVVNQEEAERDVPKLLSVGARVRFLSCEPLLGPIDLSAWIEGIHWVIAGGESGGHARQSSPSWFRGLRDQCNGAGVGFHFKQWGDWFPLEESPERVRFERRGKAKAGRLLDDRTWDEAPNVA